MQSNSTSPRGMALALGPTKAAALVRRHEAAALKELQRSYDAFQKAHKAKRKAVGLTAREDAVDAAYWPVTFVGS